MKRALLVLLLCVMAAAAFSQGYMQRNRVVKTVAAGRTATSHAAGDSVFVNMSGISVTFSLTCDTTLTTAVIYVAVNGDSTNKFPIYGNVNGGEIFTTPLSLPVVKYLKIWGSAANLPYRLWLQ